uniref:Odorant binding protein n=1 Tax=Glyphodes pyloalis TaxID=1242752 RepID=A0A6M3GXB2_GLYPY|nr:odorant binding protein [Glyphodes pyloalis]
MAEKVLIFFCLISFIGFGNSNLVPYVTKCAAADNDCTLKSTQTVIPIFAKGIPELGVETLDPVTFKKPIDASTNSLKLIIENFTLKGLKDCVIQKAVRDVKNSKLIGKLLCNVVGDGTYEMKGSLLILPVEGKGNIHVVLRQLLISIDADVNDKVGKDGKKYWDIKRFSHSFALNGKADVNFENLFTGSEVLGRAATQVFESSGNEIVLEVGPPVIQVIVKKVVENIRKFFNHVPADELALD